MRSILLSLIRIHLVLAVLGGVPAGAGRSVLCIAPDGHVAIEAGEGRCADYAPSANGAIGAAGICTVPDGCGDCVDLPVNGQVLSAAHHGLHGTNASATSSAPMCVRIANAESSGAATRPIAARAAASRPAFPPSRTTILRN